MEIYSYFDVLPTTFESSLWFEEDELAELTATALHRATKLQANPSPQLIHWNFFGGDDTIRLG